MDPLWSPLSDVLRERMALNNQWFPHNASGRGIHKRICLRCTPPLTPRFLGLKYLATPVINLHGPIGTIAFVHLFFFKLGKGGKVKRESQDAEKKETWIKYVVPSVPGLIA